MGALGGVREKTVKSIESMTKVFNINDANLELCEKKKSY